MRQLWDMKGKVNVARMDEQSLDLFATLCGRVLAKAHARSGDRHAIRGSVGTGGSFEAAMGACASSYADQVEQDFEVFVEAVSRGVLPCSPANRTGSPSAG